MKKSFLSDRRRFIKLSALSFCASQLLSPSRFLFSAGRDAGRVSEFRAQPLDGFQTRRSAFAFNKQTQPWLNAFEGTTEKILDRGGFFISGTVPSDINGSLYRVGPAWLSDQNDRFNHWFEGEGMIQVIRARTGSLSHRARAIETTEMQRLALENKREQNTLATRVKNASSKKTGAGDSSIYFPPNQSVLSLKSRLLALSDGAFHKAATPVELDRDTFGAFNIASEQRDITSHAISSHAILDRDKSVWNVVPDFQKKGIVLQRYTPEGKLYKELFHALQDVGYFHSFAITTTKIVVVVPPLVFADKNSADYLSSFVWQGNRPCRILVFDKNDFSFLFQVETDPFFVMHYINAFERDGKIIFDGLRYDDATIVLSAYRQLMSGKWGEGKDAELIFPKLVRFALDKQGVSKEVLSKNDYEFPSIDHRDLGSDYNTVVLLKRRRGEKLKGGTPYYRSVVVRDMSTGRENGYRYGTSEVPEEHIYIPDRKKSGGLGGWVIGTTYDVKSRNTAIYVFEAKSMNAGPVARGFLKYGVPMSSHGTYVPDF